MTRVQMPGSTAPMLVEYHPQFGEHTCVQQARRVVTLGPCALCAYIEGYEQAQRST